jgi:hypothetical protein
MPSEFIRQQIDTLLVQAAAALTDSDWRKVQELCAAILTFDAGNEDAHVLNKTAENALSAAAKDSTESMGGTRAGSAKNVGRLTATLRTATDHPS